MMRTCVFRAALLCAAVTGSTCVARVAHAQAQVVPTAEQVLDRHEAAVGGRAALDRHKSIRMTGTVFFPAERIRGTIEILRAKPDMYIERMTLEPLGLMVKGYDGRIAWTLEGSKPGLLTDADSETVRRQADWYHEFTVTQALRGARVDSAEFEGQPAWRLTYASGLGEEVRTYFNRRTGLRIGEESVLGIGEGTIVYGSYKTFDGIQIATRITTRRKSGELTITITDVEFDKVPSSAFALPPAVRAIAKDESPR